MLVIVLFLSALGIVLFLPGLAVRGCLALRIVLPLVLFLLVLQTGPAALKLGGRGPHHDKGIRGGDSGGGRLHGEIWVCCAEKLATPHPGTVLGEASREQKR